MTTDPIPSLTFETLQDELVDTMRTLDDLYNEPGNQHTYLKLLEQLKNLGGIGHSLHQELQPQQG